MLLAAAASVVLVAIPASAHPVLHITANKTTVVAGDTLTLTISGTSNGNYTGARIEVFSSTPSTGGTTGNLTAFTSSPTCGGSPGAVTCTENPAARYRIGNITLTNNQAFSYTLTVTVDAGTLPGTFTSKAQFYKSDNTTDGPTTGPLITVTAPPPPTADLSIVLYGSTNSPLAGTFELSTGVDNLGPATVNAHVTYTVSQTAAILSNPGDPADANGFTCTGAGTTLNCDRANYAPNTARNIHPTWTVSLLSIGQFTITATITSNTPGFIDPVPANNTLSVTCNVLTPLIVTC